MMRMTSNRLRICMYSREYPPDTGWGGIGTFAYHLAHGLVENGHEVEVISMSVGEPGTTVHDGITVHRVKSYAHNNERYGLLGRAMPSSRFVVNSSPALWKRFLELHKDKPFDVIDAPELLAEAIFPALSKVAPLVVRLYTPHSKFIAEQFHDVSPSFDNQLTAVTERIAMRNADVLTSPSRDLAEYVAADLTYPLAQIALVPNPINPAEFCPEGPKAIEFPDTLKVLFVGRLEERKGVHYLVAAIPQILKAVPTAHFYILGDDTNTAKGKKSVLAELKRDIAKARCQKNVTFIKRVPLSKLPEFYRSVDVCVVPSLYDNSPYTCLEAMSCGRPVVGTTAGGTKEYLLNGESGLLVEPRSASALAEAVITLLQNPDKRQKMGENARQRVLQKFQRKEIARQTVELYDRAIDRFASGRQRPLYLKDSVCMLADMDEIVKQFSLMLHHSLLGQSMRYRAASLIHRFRMRPKLFLAEAALKCVNRVVPSSRNNLARSARVVNWLQQQILLKHKPEQLEPKMLAVSNGSTER